MFRVTLHPTDCLVSEMGGGQVGPAGPELARDSPVPQHQQGSMTRKPATGVGVLQKCVSGK